MHTCAGTRYPQLRKIGQEFRGGDGALGSRRVGHGLRRANRKPGCLWAECSTGARAPIWAGGFGRAVLSKLPVAERKARLASTDLPVCRAPTANSSSVKWRRRVERRYALDRGHFLRNRWYRGRDLWAQLYPIAAISVIISPDRRTPATERQVAEALLNLAKELET